MAIPFKPTEPDTNPLHLPSLLQAEFGKFVSGAQNQAQKAETFGQPITQAAAPLKEGITNVLKTVTAPALNPNINTKIVNTLTSPVSTYGTPALQKVGVPAPLAVAAGVVGDFAIPGPGGKGKAFEGFTDLSTKLLESLKGRATVSKQFILDALNQGSVRQAEKDLIAKSLQNEGKTIDVPTFAEKVKEQLLPLERLSLNEHGDIMNGVPGLHHENITLPDNLRGPIAKYDEHIYNSLIKTTAGGIHFGESDPGGYFAHTRVEDLPPNTKGYSGIDKLAAEGEEGTTRRVIEIQSDLFQKGRLEPSVAEASDEFKRTGFRTFEAEDKGKFPKVNEAIQKLEPYRNNWHERIVREEVKQAAKDGKTKLQFPTGETAMKIEGLGQGVNNFSYQSTPSTWSNLSADKLSPGLKIVGHDGSWIITDVLGDGKFKAVPKINSVTVEKGMGDYYAVKNADGSVERTIKGKNEAEKWAKEFMEARTETFDISGKVDTENPIYKFYEKEVGKYLKNKYNATQVTDPKGVKWWEVNVKPETAKEPVLAYGKASLPALGIGAAASTGLGAGILAGAQGNTMTAKNPSELPKPQHDIPKIVAAIANNETAGVKTPYSFAKPSGNKALGRDLGKYQVTEYFLKKFSPRYLGREVTPEEFLNNPQIQDAFMERRVQYLINQGYTPEQIADLHRNGSTTEPGSTSYKRPEYVAKFKKFYGQ